MVITGQTRNLLVGFAGSGVRIPPSPFDTPCKGKGFCVIQRRITAGRERFCGRDLTMEKRYDTVIFDMDGTILNTLEDLHDSMNHILKQYGYPEKTLEECRKAVGNGAACFLADMLPEGRQTPGFTEMLKAYGCYYQAHSREKTRPYDGILELIESLKAQKIKTAIVSNKGDAVVKQLNRDYFGTSIEIAVGERDGIRRKPDPDSVLEALKLLDSKKETALYVGDTEVDHATAVNAGMDCVLVSWGFRERTKLEQLQPRAVIDVPEELLNLL